MENLLNDLVYSFRRMRRNPIATIVILVSLALGIGINAVVFSLINRALLQPLPLTEPERLVRLYTSNQSGDNFRAFSYPDYLDIHHDGQVLSEVVAERFIPLSLSSEGRPELVWGELVSGNYFRDLGVGASVGRVLGKEDDQSPGAHSVAVLGYGLWQRRFGGDPGVINRTVVLNGRSFTVVGVAERGFAGTFVGGRSDLWVPIMMQREMMPVGDRLEQRGARWLTVTGRLKPGVTIEQAQSALSGVAARLAQEYPDSNEGAGIHLVPFAEDTLPFQANGPATRISMMLLAVTGAVLLIACANLASILLAQASARQREIAVRQSVGARRSRLLGQFLTESVLLSLLAAGLALLLTLWADKLIARIPLPTFLPLDLSAGLDWRVVLFTLIISLVVGLALGLGPALRATRFSLTAALKGEGLDQASRGFRLRNLLVVSQITFSLVLLICAGLFVKSLRKSLDVDPGYDAEKVLVASMNLGLQGYEEGKAVAFYRQLLERIGSRPGIEAVSLGEMIPLEPGGGQQVEIEVPGNLPTSIDYNVVSPHYFATLGIPLLRGRDFSDHDPTEGTFLVVVNETLARHYWPGRDAVGQQLTVGGAPAEVIAVARDSKYGSLSESPRPYFYLSYLQLFQPTMTVHVRAAGNPSRALDIVRQEVQELDENLPLYNVKTLEGHLRVALLPARLTALFMSTFGLLALVLTAVGTYGIMMYFVSLRWREIGIRIALGARSADLLKRVLGQGLLLTIIGVGAGLLLAVLVTRWVSAMLFGVSGTDVVIFIGAALLQLLVAASATYFPARRATKVDPVTVLSGS